MPVPGTYLGGVAGDAQDPTNVLRVDSGGAGDYTSVATAATAAVSGQTIVIYPGTYTETSLITLADGVNVYQHPGAIVQTSTLAVLARVGSGCRMELAGQWLNTRNHADGGIALMPSGAALANTIIRGGYFAGTAWAIDSDTSYRFGDGCRIEDVEVVCTAAGLLAGANYGGMRIRGNGNVMVRNCVARTTRPSGTGAVTAVHGFFRTTNADRTYRIDWDNCQAYVSSAVLATAAYGWQQNGVGQGAISICRAIVSHSAAGVAYGLFETGSTTDAHSAEVFGGYFEGLSPGGTGVGIYARSNGQAGGNPDVKRFHGVRAYGTTYDIDADMTTSLAESNGSKIWFFGALYETMATPSTGILGVGVKLRPRVPRMIRRDTAINASPGSSTSPVVLDTYAIPKGLLEADGDVLEVRYSGTSGGVGATGSAKTLDFAIASSTGASQIAYSANTDSGTNVFHWWAELKITRTAQTTASMTVTGGYGRAAGGNTNLKAGGDEDAITDVDWNTAESLTLTWTSSADPNPDDFLTDVTVKIIPAVTYP